MMNVTVLNYQHLYFSDEERLMIVRFMHEADLHFSSAITAFYNISFVEGHLSKTQIYSNKFPSSLNEKLISLTQQIPENLEEVIKQFEKDDFRLSLH